ncbi:MAG: ABC transporter permease [Acidobacteriota bacterium]
MNPFASLGRIFRGPDTRRRLEEDLDAEIGHHFDEAIRCLIGQGLSPDQAREEASRRFGDLESHRRNLLLTGRRLRSRERLAEGFSVLLQNLSHSLRGLRRAPSFTLGVVLTLALGIGANAVMFSVIDRLLLRPPDHIRQPGRVRHLFLHRLIGGQPHVSPVFTYPDYEALRQARNLSSVTAFSDFSLTLGEGAQAKRVPCIMATASLWDLLGVEPALGRFFTAEEDRPGAAGTVVLGHSLWQSRFAGDPAVLGKSIRLGSGQYSVVGVAPAGFTGLDLQPVSVWLPLHKSTVNVVGGDWQTNSNWWWLRIAARLPEGVSPAAASQEASALDQQVRADQPTPPEVRISLEPLIAASGPSGSPENAVALWLAGVSLIVLLIACANVANLLLARGERWRKEIAVRLALGVSRSRLLGQLLTESLLLAGLGGVAALLLAWWGGGLVRSTLVPGVDWGGSPLNGRLLAFTLGASLLTGILAGLVPSWQSSRPDLVEALKAGARGVATGRSRTRTILLVAQTALSFVLLVGAGLFVLSLNRVRSLDLGIDPQGVLIANLETEDGSLPLSLFQRAVAKAESIPGVESAAAATLAPFGSSHAVGLRIPGKEMPRTTTGGPYVTAVTGNYFESLGIEILQGRGFLPSDSEGSARVAVVNQTMAKLIWPDEDPLGQCLIVNSQEDLCSRVVGIAEDARRQSLVEDATMQYYLPLEQRQTLSPPYILFARTQDAAALQSTLGRELQQMDPALRYVHVRRLQDRIDPRTRSWKMGASLFSLFGALALLVATLGIYSVLSFSISQRIRELGIRAALGATSSRLMGLVVGRAARHALTGIILGALAALAAGGAVAPLLFQVSPRDPSVFLLVAGVLTLSSLMAGLPPALRASRVDPNQTLRAE